MPLTPEQILRRHRLGVLAKAPPQRLAQLMPDLPAHELLRAPQIGAMMVEGRIGATGAPFNLGEMTVTRASVTLAGGTVGHAMVQGRDLDHARRAAVVDAMAQQQAPQALDILTTLEAEAAERAQTRAAKAQATRVEFFTLVRGEDA